MPRTLNQDIFTYILSLVRADGDDPLFSVEDLALARHALAQCSQDMCRWSRRLEFGLLQLKDPTDLFRIARLFTLVPPELCTISAAVHRIVVGVHDDIDWGPSHRTWLHEHIDVTLFYGFFPHVEGMRFERMAPPNPDQHRFLREIERTFTTRLLPETVKVLTIQEDFFKTLPGEPVAVTQAKLFRFLDMFPSLERLGLNAPSPELLKCLRQRLPSKVKSLKITEDIRPYVHPLDTFGQLELPPLPNNDIGPPMLSVPGQTPNLTPSVARNATALSEVLYYNLSNPTLRTSLPFLSAMAQEEITLEVAYPNIANAMANSRLNQHELSAYLRGKARVTILDEYRNVALTLPEDNTCCTRIWQVVDEPVDQGLWGE